MENRFVVEQKSLLSVLSSMQPICTKRTTLDVTAFILFQVNYKELILKTTDLEISLQASYLIIDCDLSEPQSFLVNGRRLFELVKELEGDITFTIKHNQLILKTDTVNLALNIRDAQDFPPFPERIENIMQLNAAFLLDLLSKVAFLIPQNNANSSLNGLLVEINDREFKLTATDGHCLAQVKTEEYTLAEAKQWLLPRRAVFEVKKLLETNIDKTIFLGLCGNQLVFSGESFNFFSKLLVDSFPEYAPILDKKGFVPAKVDRSHLVKTLRRSSCLLSGQFIATTFGFSDKMLNVSMQNKEVGQLQEQVPLEEFVGEGFDVRFYAPYLLSGLQVFSDKTIEFYLKDQSKPIMFKSENASDATSYNMIYLVMPVAQTQSQ